MNAQLRLTGQGKHKGHNAKHPKGQPSQQSQGKRKCKSADR